MTCERDTDVTDWNTEMDRLNVWLDCGCIVCIDAITDRYTVSDDYSSDTHTVDPQQKKLV